MIDVQNITKRYGNLTAIDRVTFSVAKGEVLAFLGPNGAGKTTTMRILTCFMPATEGTAKVAGFDCADHPLEVKRRIGYLPETPPVYQEFTVSEYLTFVGRMRGMTGKNLSTAIDQSIEKLALGTVRHRLIGNLSRGYRQRVGLAQAILHDPPVLMLDEPTDGLDPNQKHAVRQLIDVMARERTILISTHLLEEVRALCNRVVIIARGKLLADATPAELEARSRYHGAVSFSAPGSGMSQEMLGRLPQVAGIEIDPLDGRITVFPKPGARILEPVETLLREQGLEVSEIQLERGRLDEVFRQITSGDEATAGARA